MLKSYQINGDYEEFSSLLSKKFQDRKYSNQEFLNSYQITKAVSLFDWKGKNKIEFLGDSEEDIFNAKRFLERVLDFKLN